jgi:hypothetical protein
MFNESTANGSEYHGTSGYNCSNCLPVFDWTKKELWYVFSIGKEGYRYSFQLLCHVLFDQNYFIKEEDAVLGYPEFMRRFRSINEMTKYTKLDSTVMEIDINAFPRYEDIPDAMLHRDKKWAILHCKSNNYIESVYAKIILGGCYVIV